MTRRDLQGYRQRLQGLIGRLATNVAGLRREALRPLGAESSNGDTATVHEADLGSRAADEELALELLGPEEEVLAEASAALARIDEGTFGICEQCQKPISQVRLEALPYARQCIRCARVAATGDHAPG